MEHSSGLTWNVNLVLQPGLDFECLIVKKEATKSRNENKKGYLYRNYALFLQVAKNFGKNLK